MVKLFNNVTQTKKKDKKKMHIHNPGKLGQENGINGGYCVECNLFIPDEQNNLKQEVFKINHISLTKGKLKMKFKNPIEAFKKAIEEKRFSENEAENYMYMGTDKNGKDLFKNIMTRIYLTSILFLFFLSLSGEVFAKDLNLEIVYKTIAMEESKNEYGQFLIASVILNRSNEKYGTWETFALKKVCLERKQFSCWNNSAWSENWLRKNYTKDVQAKVKRAYALALKMHFKKITHYHTKNVMPYWAKNKTPDDVAGEHYFYSNIN